MRAPVKRKGPPWQGRRYGRIEVLKKIPDPELQAVIILFFAVFAEPVPSQDGSLQPHFEVGDTRIKQLGGNGITPILQV